jgi:hypothetical protein
MLGEIPVKSWVKSVIKLDGLLGKVLDGLLTA